MTLVLSMVCLISIMLNFYQQYLQRAKGKDLQKISRDLASILQETEQANTFFI